VKPEDIREEYLAYRNSWFYSVSFCIDRQEFVAPLELEERFFSRDDLDLLLRTFQNAVDIRHGAHWNGYTGNDRFELFSNAEDFFNNNPEYGVEVVLPEIES
jgi:hypothetical protein